MYVTGTTCNSQIPIVILKKDLRISAFVECSVFFPCFKATIVVSFSDFKKSVMMFVKQIYKDWGPHWCTVISRTFKVKLMTFKTPLIAVPKSQRQRHAEHCGH